MAVIDSAGNGLASTQGIGTTLAPYLAWIRQSIADDIWEWYRGHEGDAVVKIEKWIFHYTVRVHHLHGLFVLLFGEPQ